MKRWIYGMKRYFKRQAIKRAVSQRYMNEEIRGSFRAGRRLFARFNKTIEGIQKG